MSESSIAGRSTAGETTGAVAKEVWEFTGEVGGAEVWGAVGWKKHGREDERQAFGKFLFLFRILLSRLFERFKKHLEVKCFV